MDERRETIYQAVQKVVEKHLGRDDEKNRPLIHDLWRLACELKSGC